MDNYQLKLECLKLALQQGGSASDVIALAKQYYEFLNPSPDRSDSL